MNVPRPLSLAVLTFLGVSLAQAAWILAVPPYGAIDEFDHAYRAVGVAEGQWRLTLPAKDGRGLVVVVPADMVRAAADRCNSLPYTGPDNCSPIETIGGGRVSVATAAGSYNPVYYWVIGNVARPFTGAAADYAMRIGSAFICALGIAFSMWCLVMMRAGPWARFGLLASLTPVLVYTTMVPAPNSIEIVAGLCLWTSLFALASDVGHRRQRVLLLAATVAGSALAVPRLLGPMWLGLVVAVLFIYVGPQRVRELVRRHPGSFALSAATQCLAVAVAAWWTLSAGLTRASGDIDSPSGADFAADTQDVFHPGTWILQTVGAFPFRDQPAPVAAYVLVLLVVGVMIWVGLRRGLGRERIAIGSAVALTLAVPFTLSYLTAETQGVIWQGRYGLPLVVGILIMCGLVMDRFGWAAAEGSRLLLVGLGMLAIAHTWSVWKVGLSEGLSTTPIAGVLAALAWVVLGLVVLTAPGVAGATRQSPLTGMRGG